MRLFPPIHANRWGRPILLAVGLLIGSHFLAASAQTGLPAPAVTIAPYFSEVERVALQQFWNAPTRYETGTRTDPTFGVRLTPEASKWFWNYNRAVKATKAGTGAIGAGTNVKAVDKAPPEWEAWVDAKLKYDRAQAQLQVDAANALIPPVQPAMAPPVVPPPAPPPFPGLMPASLQAAIGNAPAFATCAALHRFVVNFDTGESFKYNDYVAPSSPRYAYFRFAQGVSSNGTALSKMAPEVLDQIFALGNMTPSDGHVMRVVSGLEGGFDAINTYDSGYVSVGFIQFAALEDGGNSLADVLLYEKHNYPDAFAQDFRAFGVDVSEKGSLIVVDPSTGAELSAGEAAMKIIDDKRLIAVFHLAGVRSVPFRSAQLYVAKNNYYPADLPVQVTVNGQILTGKVSDVIHSEAGLATLFDRKVNTGNVKPLNDVLSQTMAKYTLTSLDQLQPYEREIINAMKWRHDFLKDEKLTQPA